MILEAKKFKIAAACSKQYKLQSILHDKEQTELLKRKAISMVCRTFLETSKKELTLSKLKSIVKSVLQYEADWFTYDWQSDIQRKEDLLLFERLFKWFMDGSFEFEKLPDQSYSYVLPQEIQLGDLNVTQLSAKPDLILKYPDGKREALFIRTSKTDVSLKGRSSSTRIDSDVNLIVAKLLLEEKYPGISCGYFFLRCERDLPDAIAFDATDGTSKKDNHLVESFDSKNDLKTLESKLLNILNEPFKKDCVFGCFYSGICPIIKQSLGPTYNELTAFFDDVNSDKTYKLPLLFNKDQQEAIRHIDGALCVPAGPGSGKTATLVARCIYMLQSGIVPENILLVAFTNKAVDEISERVIPYCKDGRYPKITTIDSLAQEILINCSCGGSSLKLLTETDELKIIFNLTRFYYKLHGVSYKLIFGRNGLLDVLRKRIHDYLSYYKNNQDEFFAKYEGLSNDFIKLAEEYEIIIKHGNYITFEQQLSMCNDLLQTSEQLQKIYGNMYRYIMIDEFQDINSEQELFFELLQKEYGNICIFGDDDQAIYRFRKGSSKYMLEFKTKYNAAEIILSDNYRSTTEIVDYASHLIEHVPTQFRIQKNLVAHSTGSEPVILEQESISTLNDILDSLVKQYDKKQIAILAPTNAALKELLPQLNCNALLSRSYLTDDVLFLLVYNLLKLKYEGMNDKPLYSLLSLLDKNIADELVNYRITGGLYGFILNMREEYKPVLNYSYYEEPLESLQDDFFYLIFGFISYAHKLIEAETPCDMFVKHIANSLGIERSLSLNGLQDLIKSKSFKSLTQMYDYLHYMIMLEDETLTETNPTVDAVRLLTLHESKGKEFDAVIMYDTQKLGRPSSKKASPEELEKEQIDGLRLAYVGMTRAKKTLYVLSDGRGLVTDILSSFADNYNKERRRAV